MANLRTKLRGLGCADMTINSLKNKSSDNRRAAFNVEKPKRAEVNYCPQHPKGETVESLEKERAAILSEMTKRNNNSVVSEKMENTFSYRRQEVLQGQPMVAHFKSRWPALFTEREIDKEFLQITTKPLLSTFFAELDQYTPRLIEVFRGKGGTTGKKIRGHMLAISKNTDSKTNSCMEQTVMGVYVIQKEGAEPEDEPEDIDVLIEGAEALTGLGNIAQACALLFGLIYCLNLSYPPELKSTFEVFQKLLLNLDGQRLSSKVQFLKNKLMG
ncbi:uncharacterized protein LOC115433254 isoform X2 [Sphaeramia orbicularis]|uniref:uncharacterized protein LOC115433254 isoform X2 n=1 Tax=Sphaeramia orbicularis TaxID=375764 RepID=UPI00117CDB16|nr:uncharacterized protein LOC115433254 isoform X2 [Sphaeramia orbicularis]